MAKKKHRPVEAVARHEASVPKNDRVLSDDGRKLEPREYVGAETPDSDPDVTPPKTRPKPRKQ